jgi:hypothetical protein
MWSTPGEPWRARAVGGDYQFKKVNDEETKCALFPSNYPQSRLSLIREFMRGLFFARFSGFDSGFPGERLR